MKMASIYFNREDIAKKLGIEVDQLVFGKVESNYHEVQFDVIIDSDAEVKKVAEILDHPPMVRRQRFEDLGE